MFFASSIVVTAPIVLLLALALEAGKKVTKLFVPLSGHRMSLRAATAEQYQHLHSIVIPLSPVCVCHLLFIHSGRVATSYPDQTHLSSLLVVGVGRPLAYPFDGFGPFVRSPSSTRLASTQIPTMRSQPPVGFGMTTTIWWPRMKLRGKRVAAAAQ